jgi:hypothetical protein
MRFELLPRDDEAFRFSFEAKRAALGPYIREHWGWDERFQIEAHRECFLTKPFSKIIVALCEVGTVSLGDQPDHLRFGEFYLFPPSRLIRRKGWNKDTATLSRHRGSTGQGGSP